MLNILNFIIIHFFLGKQDSFYITEILLTKCRLLSAYHVTSHDMGAHYIGTLMQATQSNSKHRYQLYSYKKHTVHITTTNPSH